MVLQSSLSTFAVGIVALFVLGFMTGYVAHHWLGDQHDADYRQTIGFLISLVWVASVARELTAAHYTTPLAIHGMMGAVAGWLFGSSDTDLLGTDSSTDHE